MNRKEFILGSACALGTALYSGAPLGAATNITSSMNLPNIDFSEGKAHWELRGGAAAEETYQIGQANGQAALLIKITEQSDHFLRKSTFAGRKDLPVGAGYYRLCFRMRTDLTAGYAYPQIFARSSDHRHQMLASLEDNGVRRITGTSPWREYTLIYEVPSDIEAVHAWFRADEALGEVALADIRLERLETPSAKVLLAQSDGLSFDDPSRKLIYKEDFADARRWSAEGVGTHWCEDGKLYMDCVTNGRERVGGMTLWFLPEIQSDIYITYETTVLEPENWNNLNFFLMGRTLDGRLASEADFNGDYGQYHKEAKTYIGTLTYRWSRMRKDPGFHVISEDFNTTGEVNQKYFFEITKRGGILEWRINGKLIHHAEDDDPYQSGQFAIRSAGTFSWVRNFRIYQYV